MTKGLICVATLSLLTACTQNTTELEQKKPAQEKATQELHSGIAIDGMDTSVRPGNDFFSYANGSWVATIEMPGDKSKYGTFDILRDESQVAVKTIIDASASGDFPKGSDQQKVGDLYRSFMDIDTRNARGIEPLRPELDRIDAITDYDALAVYFASAMRRNHSAPIGMGQSADFKNPKQYMIYVTQSGLGLPDREYYLKDDAQSAALREQYVEHIETMFDLAGFENGAQAATTVFDLETRLAEQNMRKEDRRNWAVNYNKVPLAALSTVMPRFNWGAYLNEAGLEDIDSIVFLSTDYLQALDEIIVETDLDTWKTYLYWSALNTVAGRLTDAIDKQNFAFYGKALSGTKRQRPNWRRGVNSVNGLLGEVVGKVYVKEHFPPEAKARMLELVGNLINAYEKSIKELDWMSEETKLEALDKLSKFTPKVGYPDEWRDYSALDIEAEDYFGNVERASIADYQRQMDRQGGPVDRTEWGIMPQTVNAYYSPALNEIVFPAAILQPPFFDMNAEDAVNYGGIGAVIGHEIGHGFDNSGSNFDGDGVLRNWWTDEDRAEFEARTENLIAQYDAFKPFDDLSVNGEFTLGENIGDLGGVGIGLLAYQMSLDGNEAPIIDGFTGVQRVFLGFAQVWRAKYREERLRLQIGTDPHAPSMYRANGAVRNVAEFYEAFDVAEGDALYLRPEERVKIW